MKLNLGCGTRKFDGFVNADIQPECSPDVLMDMTKPWDMFEDDTFDEIIAYHVLEHFYWEDFIHIIKEIYRVAADGCEVKIEIPHPRHDDYFSDPTHKIPLLPQTFNLFDRSWVLDVQREGYGNTPLALYHNVNIIPMEHHRYWDDDMFEKMSKGEIDQDTLKEMELTHCNIVKAYGIDCIVKKL